MRTEVTHWYEWHELSPGAKADAVAEFRESDEAFDDEDFLLCRTIALEAFYKELGVADDEVEGLDPSLDLSFSQGSGFSVEGGPITVMGGRWTLVRRSSMYVHENTVVPVSADDDLDTAPDEVMEAMRRAMRIGHRAAQDAYWSIQSDDSIADRLAGGPWEYLESGKGRRLAG